MPPKLLGQKGLSTLYADESDDKEDFVIAFVRIPTLTRADANHSVEWDVWLDAAKAYRKTLYTKFGVPISKELKGSKLATGRNRYFKGKDSIYGSRAVAVYKFALEQLAFLPSDSIFSITAPKGYSLYGYSRLEAALYAAFQRIQKQCEVEMTSTVIFCDEGHAEYRRLYRKACVHMPTGSKVGAWASGKSAKNIPLTRAIKDLNFKESKSSHFIQIADLIAYATLLKRRKESGRLSQKEKDLGLGDIHDHIPRRVLNVKVEYGGKDGIKRLK